MYEVSQIISTRAKEISEGSPIYVKTLSQDPIEMAKDELLVLEQAALGDWQSWCDGLEHGGLSQERRALRLVPANTGWRWIEADLELSFSLAAGEFATAVLRELVQLNNTSQSAQGELE